MTRSYNLNLVFVIWLLDRVTLPFSDQSTECSAQVHRGKKLTHLPCEIPEGNKEGNHLSQTRPTHCTQRTTLQFTLHRA